MNKYYYFRKYLYEKGLPESRIEETFNAISTLHRAYCAMDNNTIYLLNTIGITELVDKFAKLEELNNNFNIK